MDNEEVRHMLHEVRVQAELKVIELRANGSSDEYIESFMEGVEAAYQTLLNQLGSCN